MVFNGAELPRRLEPPPGETMNIERAGDQMSSVFHAETTLPYLVELHTRSGPLAYVVAHADTRDDARALVDAQLGREDDNDEVIIVSVHPIH